MISSIQPLAAGNALRVFIDPPANAVSWRLLRKDADTFTGQDDVAAVVVMDGDERIAVDAVRLANSVPAFYRVYAFNGSAWTAGETKSATPLASYKEVTTDVLQFVRERLDVGLQVEVARGTLKAPAGHIQVLTAPPVYEASRWPVVSVHLDNDASAERGLGEQLESDSYSSSTDSWTETEGWLADVQLTVMGWSLNPDQRIELRKALRRIIIANLPIFDSIGMVRVNLSQRDGEDFTSYEAPVYQAICTLSCEAPVLVANDIDTIHEVDVVGIPS